MAALALTINGNTEHLPEDEANRDTAMQRYWEAKQRGDMTARLVRVEDLVAANDHITRDPDDDDPPPAAPAASQPIPESPVLGGTVSVLAHERIQLQESWLAKAGFAMAPPLYAPGTRVLPLGDQNFRVERQRVERLPVFRDAADLVTAEIRTENRRDVNVPLRELSMTDHGTLMVGEAEHALELGAFTQLATLCGFGMGARYLAERCDAPLRADNVNAQLAKAKDRVLTLRTRSHGDDQRQAFAVVTPTYAAVDTDAVLGKALMPLMDARVEMLYDGAGSRATALWMPDQVVDLAAGDIFKAGVRIETDDTGRGRVRVSAVVFRNRCLNLLVIGEGTVETVSAVHKGDPGAILAKVEAGIDGARAKVADFLGAWGHARTVRVDPEVTIRRWVEDKKLGPIGDKARDAIVEALLSAWQHEPGDTLADCVNAVSRAAHEHPFWGMDFRQELERRTASLVLVPR